MSHDDPVVQRVRETRRKIFESCGNDPHKLYEWAKQIEAQYQDRLAGFERTRRPTPKPSDRDK